MAGLCYLPVSMVIKVASENGHFLRTVKFGHFRNILTLTSNGWCCAGSFALGFNWGGSQGGSPCWEEDVGLGFSACHQLTPNVSVPKG